MKASRVFRRAMYDFNALLITKQLCVSFPFVRVSPPLSCTRVHYMSTWLYSCTYRALYVYIVQLVDRSSRRLFFHDTCHWSLRNLVVCSRNIVNTTLEPTFVQKYYGICRHLVKREPQPFLRLLDLCFAYFIIIPWKFSLLVAIRPIIMRV